MSETMDASTSCCDTIYKTNTVSLMSYHQFQNEDGESYGSFEVFFYFDSTGTSSRITALARLLPGCFPDDAFAFRD